MMSAVMDVRTAIAAARSLLAYVVVGLYALIVGPPAILLTIVFRWKSLLFELGHAGAWLALTMAGIRTVVEGEQHVPRDRAVVFCANHQSNVDPPVLFETLHRRLHILYKAELSKLPLLGQAFVVAGFVPVERDNRERSMESIAQGATSLQAGNSFLIFPEGTRSRTRELLPFKKGGFIMALQAQAPIVPVAVDGGRAAMRKGSVLVWPTTVHVRIGKPIETTGLSIDDRDVLIGRVRGEIERLLEAIPGAPAAAPA
jgi:1-acyl-sn-glycerol-3-phosphate acyltransferase